ncbi:MAG: HAD family phosphatase [Williamsia sp.]|nr:HAD family phosphatase [Williamsia sp.]
MNTSANFHNIEAILFDLGGVLLNLDYHLTGEAFINLGIANFNELYTQFHATKLFEEFEKGEIGERQFIDELKKHAPAEVTDEDIEQAWNAMLLDYPPGRIEFLQAVRSRYKTYLLSNTNAIHYKAVQQIYTDQFGGGSLDSLFEKSFYSYKTGMRKPDADIFELVLSETGLSPATTLFIDDTPANIYTAEALGIRSLFLSKPHTVEELFAQHGLLT